MDEIWKSIEGFEGLYEISNLGQIKSMKRAIVRVDGVTSHLRQRLLKHTLSSRGYSQVGLLKNKKATTLLVHRLIALAFIPNPENKPHINHIDGNKINNHISNLEWCTPLENAHHAMRIGLRNVSENPRKPYSSRNRVNYTISQKQVEYLLKQFKK